ncbi:MAG: galactokinase [Acidobacteria bacterium]|nr:galactokinase [Acidobacteriota bacterium]
MVDIAELIHAFRGRYGSFPRVFFAPGRVNLIGEHTDYNEGFVLPMAIDRGTAVAIAARPDTILRAFSLNLNDTVQLNVENPGPGRHGNWLDYVEGMVSAITERGIILTGADVALASDVSIGGGLSSSAALEVALGMALVSISGGSLDKRSLAFAGQTAEYRHVGIHCGIMDQFTSVFAQRNHAILLDCRSLDAKNVPLRIREYQVVICDSRVRHSLASSEYNQRRQDCELGAKLLSTVHPGLRSLRDASLLDLEKHQSSFTPRVMQCCRHVISENDRTLRAAQALSAGDVFEMGKLMSESHNSLRNDYRVSCRELDLLVEIAMTQSGVLGARMTGGGFGGCTVNLVHRENFQEFCDVVAREYQTRTDIKPVIFAVDAGDGAREIIPKGSQRIWI